MNRQTVIVDLKQCPYPLYIGQRLLQNSQLLRKHLTNRQVMIVTNDVVAPLYLSTVKSHFNDCQCDVVILPDGETYKTLAQLERIWNALAQRHHHRDTTLIALGGGVIGDMTGFAAACYQRGVTLIQIPTTLLAQVDSSIGGKTAVNHPAGKNFIGAFYQPQAVIMSVDTLTTLPAREFNAGIAEIIKAALLYDAEFFVYLENAMPELLQREQATVIYVIKRACEIKRDIVVADERETCGKRALLNLGHTFAHAIEQTLGYGTWLHGEAVAAGLVLAATLSQQKGWLAHDTVTRVEKLLQRISLPTRLPPTLDVASLVRSMQMDKKVIASQLRLILLQAIGRAVITADVNTTEIATCLLACTTPVN